MTVEDLIIELIDLPQTAVVFCEIRKNYEDDVELYEWIQRLTVNTKYDRGRVIIEID